MFSKSYKEKKKHYEYQKQKAIDDVIFEKARTNLNNSFELISIYFDDYHCRNFIRYVGMTVKYTTESTEYDLVKILPQAIENYNQHLLGKEK